MFALIVCLIQHKKSCLTQLVVVRYFFPTFENDGLLCGLPDDDDDDAEEENVGRVCEHNDGVNCWIHGLDHRGKSANYSNMNYNVESEHSDSINIDNNDGVHAVVGNDKQPDKNCSETDCGVDRNHGKNNENDTKNESNEGIDCLVVLVNNDDRNDKQTDDSYISKDIDGDHNRNVGLSETLVVNAGGGEDHADDGESKNYPVNGTSSCTKRVGGNDG